jgi:hypothetical protein
MRLLRKLTRLRVRASELPITGSKILGEGIDISVAPDGHLSCPGCQRFRFEVSKLGDSHRLEIGCMHCGWNTRLLLPIDCDLSRLDNGRFSCLKHKDRGMVIIKNNTALCIGCESCATQIVLDMRSNTGLVVM